MAHSPVSDLPVERAADHVLLLLLGEPDEVHGVAGHPDRQLRILVRMLIASFSVSLSMTFRFMWKPPWPKNMSKAFAADETSSSSVRCAFCGATETV